MTTKANELTREQLLDMLRRFICQRPGFEWANYGDTAAYQSDYRGALKDRDHALTMLQAVTWRFTITADDIRKALQTGGRLTLSDAGELDYCTGQYFPTKYRAAACRVLSSILWDYWRENEAASRKARGSENPYGTGQTIRDKARQELGRSIANRWFN